MDVTTEAGVLFDNDPRHNLTIVNPWVSSNLEGAAGQTRKHVDDAVERKNIKYRGSFPTTYSSFLSLCRRVVNSVQTYTPSSKNWPTDALLIAQSSTLRSHGDSRRVRK